MEQQVAEMVVELTNQERIENGLPALVVNESLRIAAETHSREMCELDYFDHRSPTPGRHTLRQRINQAGSNPKTIAENIYHSTGYALEDIPERALEALMSSTGHRRNILHSAHKQIGVGVVHDGHNCYVTQVFSGG